MFVNKVSSNMYNNYGLSKNNRIAFNAKSDNNISVHTVSFRDADNLKYDVEYNKISRFKNNFNIVGDNIDVTVIHGVNGSKLIGNAYNHDIDAKYVCTGYNANKMLIRGTVDDKDISLKYNILGNNVNIEGDISGLDKETITLLNMIARDYSEVAANQINTALAIVLALP